MKNAPWAKFTMRMMPKISVRPTPRKNSSAAWESAFRHWVMRKPRKFIGAMPTRRPLPPHPPRRGRGRAANPPPPLRGGGWGGGAAFISLLERHLPARRGDFVTRQRRDDLRYRRLR